MEVLKDYTKAARRPVVTIDMGDGTIERFDLNDKKVVAFVNITTLDSPATFVTLQAPNGFVGACMEHVLSQCPHLIEEVMAAAAKVAMRTGSPCVKLVNAGNDTVN